MAEEEIVAEEETVELIANGYYWECPGCLQNNIEDFKMKEVTCIQCHKTFKVDDWVHPTDSE